MPAATGLKAINPTPLAPVLYVLKSRKYRFIMLMSGMVYALVYMFVVGIISYYPGFAPLKVSTPVINPTTIGLTIVPGHYIFVFAFYSAIGFMAVSSFLVGLNISLILRLRNLRRTSGYYCCRTTTISSGGILSTLPAFFTTFSCCGSGLLALVVGPTTFSSLALYSHYLAPLSIAALTIGAMLTSTKINGSYPSPITNNDYCCQVRTGGRDIKNERDKD